MNKCIAELPMVTTPKPREELIMYLCTAREAISAVLLTEKDSRKIPIYFVSRALQAPEINYNSMEKVVLALVHATRRLRMYFKAHLVAVVIDQPIKQILSRSKNTRRMLKWKFKLKAFDITCRPRTSIRGQILADFIAKKPDEGGSSMKVQTKETVPKLWVLFTDGSSCLEGSGARLILTSPESEEFTYVLRFEFDASNNEAEYEALVAGLRIAEQMGVKNLIAKVDSLLVASQINGLYEAKEQSINQYLENTRTLIGGFKKFSIEQLRPPHQASPGRNTQKKVNRRKGNPSNSGRRGVLLDDTAGRIPYRGMSFLEPWLRCFGPTQAKYVVKEIHEGSYNMHSGPRFVVAKVIRSKYYWPIMHKDAWNIIRACNDCQTHRPVPRNPQQKLTPITSPWPFHKWGIDISGPFPEGQGKCEKLNIKQRFASVKHPQTNGQVERANRCLGEGIKARLGEDNINWVEEVPHLLWVHRIMIKTSNGDTSFSLTYGTEAVIPVEIRMPLIRCAEVIQVENDEELLLNLDILEERREKAAVREAKNKAIMAKYYNAKVRSTSFRPGDFVYRSNKASRAKESRKLGPKREGPYEVVKALRKGACKLRNGSRDILLRTWNVQDLKMLSLNSYHVSTLANVKPH
ncbi:reverse transcriptase domain-containing protein [Tanacetum coccineum]